MYRRVPKRDGSGYVWIAVDWGHARMSAEGRAEVAKRFENPERADEERRNVRPYFVAHQAKDEPDDEVAFSDAWSYTNMEDVLLVTRDEVNWETYDSVIRELTKAPINEVVSKGGWAGETLGQAFKIPPDKRPKPKRRGPGTGLGMFL
jgi:hypothetical protein